MSQKVEALLAELMTTKEVADHFGVHVRDVQYAIKRGRIPAYRFGGYFYVIHRDELPASWPTK